MLRSRAKTRPRKRRESAGQGGIARRKLNLESLEPRQLLALVTGLAAGDGEGESNAAVVALRLEATDLTGAPITETAPGSQFYLSAWVRDQRPTADPAGVYAAYLDITYDADLLAVVASNSNPLGFDITFGPEYENGISGNVSTPGLIDEVGAFQTGYSPLGRDEVLLFRTRFSTNDVNLVDDTFTGIPEDPGPIELDVLANDHVQVGKVQFTGGPADVRPLHDVVLFQPASAVAHDAIQYGTADVNIAGVESAVIEDVSTPSAGGSVRIAADGAQLVYQPALNFHGTETFTYTVAGDTATVTVLVDPVNDAPTGVDDIYATTFESTLVVDAARGVLSNDTDVEGDAFVARIARQPNSGSIDLREDGSFEYIPATGFRGRDAFTYVADDAQTLSEEITVRIDVGTPQVSIRLELTDDAGQPLDRAASDEAIFLRAWVEDLRDDYYLNRGVFAAYLDVIYDPQFLQPIIDAALPHGFEIDFGADFSLPGNGDVDTPALINEVGSFTSSFEPLGPGEVLLFAMPLVTGGPHGANDAYTVSFQSVTNQFNVLENDLELVWATELVAERADQSPDHDVLLFQPPAPVMSDQIVLTDVRIELSNTAQLAIVDTSVTTAGGDVATAPDGKTLFYSPPPGFVGTDSLRYTIADTRGQTAEVTVVIEVIASWQNLRNPLDVNSDTYVSPVDALLVIHDLNNGGGRPLVDPPTGPPFVDVNGDGQLSPQDALLVIAFLNSGDNAQGESAGEGESSSTVSSVRPPALPSTHTSSNVSLTASVVETELFRLPANSNSRARLLPSVTEELDEFYQHWERREVDSRVQWMMEDLLEWLSDEESKTLT